MSSTADRIRCLECGRSFVFLPTHLARTHDLTAREYRRRHALPAGAPLAGRSYRAAHAATARRLWQDGTLTTAHLPRAVVRAHGVARTARTPADRAAQRERARRLGAARQLPDGARRTDGRDADRARAYQRAYRALKAGDPAPMAAYRAAHGVATPAVHAATPPTAARERAATRARAAGLAGAIMGDPQKRQVSPAAAPTPGRTVPVSGA